MKKPSTIMFENVTRKLSKKQLKRVRKVQYLKNEELEKAIKGQLYAINLFMMYYNTYSIQQSSLTEMIFDRLRFSEDIKEAYKIESDLTKKCLRTLIGQAKAGHLVLTKVKKEQVFEELNFTVGVEDFFLVSELKYTDQTLHKELEKIIKNYGN